jgi:hypothetical protein
MSKDKTRPDRLEAFKRWQSAELEEAKVRMAQMNEAVAERLSAVDRIENEIVSLHSLAREQTLSSEPLRPDVLQRLSSFNDHQRQVLQSARASHDQATRQADDAQQSVLHVFERLSVVERLLERRGELAGKEQQRELQKRLDEGALSRTPNNHHETTTDRED